MLSTFSSFLRIFRFFSSPRPRYACPLTHLPFDFPVSLSSLSDDGRQWFGLALCHQQGKKDKKRLERTADPLGGVRAMDDGAGKRKRERLSAHEIRTLALVNFNFKTKKRRWGVQVTALGPSWSRSERKKTRKTSDEETRRIKQRGCAKTSQSCSRNLQNRKGGRRKTQKYMNESLHTTLHDTNSTVSPSSLPVCRSVGLS